MQTKDYQYRWSNAHIYQAVLMMAREERVLINSVNNFFIYF